jgi:hypothetical protein
MLTLFVEDNIDTLRLYEYIAKEKGLYADNLLDAYLLYKEYKPLRVILDFNIAGEMPLDFVDYVKKDNPKVDIYIVTAYNVEVPLRFFHFDKNRIFTKPKGIGIIKKMILENGSHATA